MIMMMMTTSRSHPAVHPVEETPQVAPLAAEVGGGAAVEAENAPRRVLIKDIQGMPGTPFGLALRICQFAFAVISLGVMVTTPDFASATAFRYLVGAVSLQSTWSLSLAIIDIYALLVKRCLRNSRIICLFTFGDGITSTLTFAAACSSAGITVLIGDDFNNCAQNHCTRFQTAISMAFMSWFAISPSFFLNYWSLASR